MIKSLTNFISNKLDETGAQYKAYGIFGSFNFPLYYIVWLYLSPETYESLTLRIICTLLCFSLIFHEKWPNNLKKYLPIYWYLTLTFTLPFFFTFMLIMNHGSEMWMTNTIVIVFFMLLLVDWVTAVILLSIGSLFGILVAAIFTSEFFPPSFNFLGFFITYFVAIVIGMIFAHNKQIIERVRRRSIKAEANSKAKSEFIANMSHDLRTPITGILGMVQDMLNTADSAKESLGQNDSKSLKNMIETVQRDGYYLIGATDELLQLCNEILEVVQLESGKFEGRIESFDLRCLIKHNVELLQPVARHKKLQLSYSIDASVPQYFSGYRIYLDRVLLNLISNALKFTEEGSVKIIIKLLRQIDIPVAVGKEVNLQIVVEDTGVGIPEDKYEKIFEHFSRLTPSYEGLYKGAGLGLYTVKRYIEAMSGIINVSSELNKGACFTVVVPFKVSDHTDERKQSVRPQKMKKLTVKKPTESGHKTNNMENKAATILVVEDHMLAAIAVTAALKPFNCRVETAENGTKAVEMAQKGNYDLILMDIGLPDFSGVEATKKIRALLDTKKSQVPIVALTGHAGNPEMRQEALGAGMQEVLSKPAQPLALESVLQDYVFKIKTESRLARQKNSLIEQEGELATIIDWEACVHMCIGDTELARKMLSMLADDLKNTEAILTTAYENNDTKTLREELHRVRGGVCYLKVPQLQHTLKEFHDAVRAGPQGKTVLEESYTALKEAINNFRNTWRSSKFS